MSFLQTADQISARRGASERAQLPLALLCDALALMAAMIGAGALLGQGSLSVAAFLEYTAICMVLMIWFALRGHYQPGQGFRAESAQVLATFLATAGTLAISFAISGFPERAQSLAAGLLLAIVTVPVLRYATRALMHRYGLWRISTVIIGDPSASTSIAQALGATPYSGYDILETVSPATFFGASSQQAHRPAAPIDWARAEDYLLQRYGRNRSVLFVLAMNKRATAFAGETLPLFARHGFSVAFAPLNAEVALSGMALRRVDGLHGDLYVSASTPAGTATAAPLFPAGPRHAERAAQLFKRSMDVLLSGLAILLLAPVFVPIMALIRMDGGPAFFAQTRIGRNGERFRCLKFRTMVVDAEARLNDLLARDPAAAAEWARDQKLRNDPRVTRVGAFLRRTSLDELPQLLNILTGDMSIVGPRPVVPDELARYGDCARFYLSVRPGLTGLWQVSGRNKTSYEERVMLDVTYVLNWTLWRDLRIIAKTAAEVLWLRSGV